MEDPRVQDLAPGLLSTPKVLGEPEPPQKRDGNRNPDSAHAPYSSRGFPVTPEAHSYQLRMREAEASFPRNS